MADELPDSIPAAIPATDPSQRLPHVQGEIDGMRAVPDTGCEPWATRLDPPHPGHVAKAAGALTAITASRKHAYMVAYTLDDAGLLAVDGEWDLSALADACDDLVRAYHARDSDTVPPAVIEAVRVALGQPAEHTMDGDLNDFTAALAAADLKWAHDLGDEQSAPAYIQSLASTVWSLWIQPRLAGPPLEPAVAVDPQPDGSILHTESTAFKAWHKAISELVDRLARERDEAQQSLEAARREVSDYERQYAELWRDANTERAQFDRVLTHLAPAARQINGTVSGLALREQAGDLVKKLIADLEARPVIPADAVVLPENWRQQLGWLFTVEDAGKWTRICRLVEMWQGKRLGTDDDSNPVVGSDATSVHGVTTPGVVDGDLLRDLLADMAPPEWQDAAAGAHAEKVLAEMHRVGVTVLRGPKSEPWTPPVAVPADQEGGRP